MNRLPPRPPQVLGWQGSPFQFVISVVNVSAALQLGMAGALFYGTELGAHLRPQLLRCPGQPQPGAFAAGCGAGTGARQGQAPWGSRCGASCRGCGLWGMLPSLRASCRALPRRAALRRRRGVPRGGRHAAGKLHAATGALLRPLPPRCCLRRGRGPGALRRTSTGSAARPSAHLDAPGGDPAARPPTPSCPCLQVRSELIVWPALTAILQLLPGEYSLADLLRSGRRSWPLLSPCARAAVQRRGAAPHLPARWAARCSVPAGSAAPVPREPPPSLAPNPALPAARCPAGTEGQSRAGAFNTMAAVLAVALFLPQLLLGWDSRESLQLMLPLAAGWVVFDVSALTAVLIRLNMP
jgi:hypothetical protein